MATGPLSADELRVLTLIRQGFDTMAELVDMMKVDSSYTNTAVEKLDQARYLTRDGSIGPKFYTFALTGKGQAALPTLSPGEQAMSEQGLNPADVKLLALLRDRPGASAQEMTNATGLDLTDASTHIVKMVRRGFLGEAGLLRRRVFLTEKGVEAARKFGAIASR